jgi:hypothetical protein
MNVFHYKTLQEVPDPSVPRDLQERFLFLFGGDGEGKIAGEFKKVFANNVTIEAVEAQLVHPQRWRKSALDLNVHGTTIEACHVPNIQASFAKYGELGERSSVGSMHIGGMDILSYEEGLITVAHKARVEFLAEFLQTQKIVTAPNVTLQFVILNKRPVDPPTVPPKFEIEGSENVTSIEVMDQVRTQRSRTHGKGQ